MSKKFQKNDKVFYRTTWVSHNTGIIIGAKNVEGQLYYEIKGTGETFGTQYAKASDCFHTAKELSDGVQAESNALKQKYREEITDVKSLVQFMWNHTVTCAEEYTNWEARWACKEAIKDLLDLDLE